VGTPFQGGEVVGIMTAPPAVKGLAANPEMAAGAGRRDGSLDMENDTKASRARSGAPRDS